MDQALALLRQSRLDAGRALVDDLGACRAHLLPREASISHVMDRWYHGVRAYHLYCIEDYDAAAGEMMAAHDAVARAISHAPSLVPLANHCHEFRLHRARIARNRRRWAEMREHIDAVRAMMEDRGPLCHLADGTGVYYATLVQFYDALPRVSEDERRHLADLCDAGQRLRLFQRFVQSLYTLPGFVIPLP